MNAPEGVPARLRWARLRFQIIGQLLAAPPEHGELVETLKELSSRTWNHPTTGESVHFGVSTIERWYYQARNEPKDPVRALERKVHKNAGTRPSVSEALRKAMRALHRDHPTWSYQLHYDNLVSLAKNDPGLIVPSYNTVTRSMKEMGLFRARKARVRGERGEGAQKHEIREFRSFEVEHVNALWHLDYHECSRSVLLPTGAWKKPFLLAILDDRSRLICHAQWYLDQTAETLVHGLSQAILKRGLPRKLMSDNGKPMLAQETQEGLARLSIVHETTLPRTPEQNAKQEVFWGQVEGRLLAMLESERELSLALLNEATQAWVELEYQRKVHSEIGQTPLSRYLDGPDLGRPSPNTDTLQRAFRRPATRTQRQSDGTISLEGVRFEVPSRYRALTRAHVRYATWDLSTVDLCDEHTGDVLCTLLPLDKNKNADGKRRVISVHEEPAQTSESKGGMAPLLRALMADYAATGLPPAYLPHRSHEETSEEAST
jgi:transposase InsO family protein